MIHTSRHTATLLVALVSLAATARETDRCNTKNPSYLTFETASEAGQQLIGGAAGNPSLNPDLFRRLWEPTRVTVTTTALSSRFVTLHYDPIQDVEQIRQEIMADPSIRQHVLTSFPPTAPACFLPPPNFLRVTEFRNRFLNHYFLSSSPSEDLAIDSGAAGPGWERTGESFTPAANNDCNEWRHVFRFYAPSINSHFFTADPDECASVRKADSGWIYEGVAFMAAPPEKGLCPTWAQLAVYRFYNNRWRESDSNHRYTVKPEVYRAMNDAGWTPEGIAFCLR